MRSLEKELKTGNYDLVYERYAFFLVAGAIKSKKYNIPFVLEANEVSGIQDRARKQTFKKLCDKFERFLFQRCDSIHTVSSYLRNMIMEQGVSAEKIEVTPNAIDPNKFSGNHKSVELVKKYQLENEVVLGFAGWFDDWDRLDLLLDVFNDIKQVKDNVKLLLVGDGAVLDPLRIKIKEFKLEEDVILTGAVTRDQVQDYISLLDIAVITHSNEFGSPVVMFEFMGLKIPIVAPDLLPITDVLTDGINGEIFDVLNMEQLKGKLLNLIDDESLRTKLADNAYAQLMAKHTWKNNAQAIVQVLS